ncbi:uncharacterized protein TRAVEDRAFT_126432 [Trametes versicolor FP-101664 SS1]|uniref:uncharacterized protein n=1 Tax=Trametes versicolor (strain FP-101664) TaxID=717944 RepID=UPI00046212FD|nr:uncharacterized protein TRAVEDRAFT_126432 [Trametes versicolor FP-101664 SS1]EIW58007.1 hypothetical protein TRAVEDRAFT_126432 [Trametes versicolor FP-101664 SS1]
MRTVFQEEITDKEGCAIEVGDSVATRFRGGKRQGEVEAIIVNKQDAKEQGPDLDVNIKNPPKVVFQDQVSVLVQ